MNTVAVDASIHYDIYIGTGVLSMLTPLVRKLKNVKKDYLYQNFWINIIFLRFLVDMIVKISNMN